MTAFENILKAQNALGDNRTYGMGRKTTIKRKDFRTAVNFDDEVFKNEDPIMVRQAFMEQVLSQYTPIAIQSELYMKPIPKSVGAIQCTIYRESGMMSSSFYLKLSDSNTEMLKAEKVMQSTTKHYKIKIDTPYMKYTNSENELYIGRLRANFSANSFFFYDYGMNAKDAENRQKLGPGQFIRRQMGTALYMKTDRMGNKQPKHIEVYIPEVKE